MRIRKDLILQCVSLKGRARRRELFGVMAGGNLVGWALASLYAVAGAFQPIVEVLSYVFFVAIIVPTLAVYVRRVHDTGRSGWWLFLPLMNVVFLIQRGEVGANRYGPDPRPVARSENTSSTTRSRP